MTVPWPLEIESALSRAVAPCDLGGYLDSPPQSLYIHVPFCRSKCGYCDFFSRPGYGRADFAAFVDGLLAELDFFMGLPWRPDWDGCFDTVFIGGGTPSLLPLDELDRLLGGIDGRIGKGNRPTREWTVECNPESLGEGQLGLFSRHGVNRISMGLQSLEEAALALSGRPGSLEESLRALDLVSREWEGRWNADFIAGLPGQSREGLVSDMRRVARSGADHVSLYSLSIEEGTPFHDKLMENGRGQEGCPPLQAEADDMWFAARDELADAGFSRYEVSNFCRPGGECRHNLHYWRVDPYLGLGPGAVSTFLLPGGASLRRSVRPDIEAYAAKSRGSDFPSLAEYEGINPRDSLKDYLLMALRTDEGIRAQTLKDRFMMAPEEFIRSLREALAVPGLPVACAVPGSDLELSLGEEGLNALNPILIRSFDLIDSLERP